MRTTVAVINLDRLASNLEVVRRRAPQAKILAMVKANAYGHGLVGTSRVLQHLGVEMLGVAFVHEAEALREGGVSAPILVITPTTPEDAPSIVQHALHVVVCSVEEAAVLSRAGQAAGVTIPVHLYVDTGMHRDGVAPENVVPTLEAMTTLASLDVCGICTHFATADQVESPFLDQQLQSFLSVVDAARDHGFVFAYIHAANTASIWHRLASHCTMVRPGLSLYGYGLLEVPEQELLPVMSLQTTITGLRRIRAGEGASYGRRYIAPHETTIATLPIGYGDGYFRGFTGKTWCLIHGTKYPIVGTICMDACMVDVGNADVAIGDVAVLLGEQQGADGVVQRIDAMELAAVIDSIPYEVLTAISERVPRAFVGRLSTVAQLGEVSSV